MTGGQRGQAAIVRGRGRRIKYQKRPARAILWRFHCACNRRVLQRNQDETTPRLVIERLKLHITEVRPWLDVETGQKPALESEIKKFQKTRARPGHLRDGWARKLVWTGSMTRRHNSIGERLFALLF